MNKVTIYILLILVYLGLSKHFGSKEKGDFFLNNEQVFANYFTERPISVILIKSFDTGFFIKTYYHQYKIVHAFKKPRFVTLRISKSFAEKNKMNLGMSLFRRSEFEESGNIIPMPPGTLFIGDLAYGNWWYINSGKKIWTFHRPYRHFYTHFGWQSFRPSYSFYQTLLTHKNQGLPFYGENNEFGTNGSISKNLITKNRDAQRPLSLKLKKYLYQLWKTPGELVNL